ncbi:MAG: hypothetical protein KDA60_08600, partial [Planctomycetales bacterium]|nr:hypothetical protein [Planctomycetales bacterium]
MTPERWQRIKVLLTDLLALGPAATPAAISLACEEDPSLEREVRSLLEYYDKALDAQFLEATTQKTQDERTQQRDLPIRCPHCQEILSTPQTEDRELHCGHCGSRICLAAVKSPWHTASADRKFGRFQLFE